MNDNERKAYLGDGVYASHDGFSLRLETERENGTHYIYFETRELLELIAFAERIGMITRALPGPGGSSK